MDLEKLHSALDEANAGLREVSDEYEILRQKKDQLETVVSSIRALLGIKDSPLDRIVAPRLTLHNADISEEPTNGSPAQWKMAQELLRENKRAMTVPEMMEVLTRRGHKLQGDGLRVAMIRRPDLFYKPSYGKYGLCEWKPDVEKVGEERVA
jgi:hypothetical protein